MAEQIPALETNQLIVFARRLCKASYKTPKPSSMLKAIFRSRFRFKSHTNVVGRRARNISTNV